MRQTANNSASGGDRTRAPRAGAAARAPYEPAYLHIANTIAEQIGAGVYRPGDQLPTEPQLRATFGVSPVTVRRAVNILLDRGLVTTTQGKGTFVRSLDMGEAVFRLQEITDMWTEDDASVDVRLLEARIVPATDEVARDARAASRASRWSTCAGSSRAAACRSSIRWSTWSTTSTGPWWRRSCRSPRSTACCTPRRGEGMPSGRLTIQAVSLDAEAAKLPEGPRGVAGVLPGAPLPRLRRPAGQLGHASSAGPISSA